MRNLKRSWIFISSLLSLYPVYVFVLVLYKMQTDIFIEGQNQYSSYVSKLCICIVLIISIWTSLYFAYKIKSKYEGENRKVINLKAIGISFAIFVLLFFLLPFTLIDNRTSTGDIAFINFESISYTILGFFHLLVVLIATLFI